MKTRLLVPAIVLGMLPGLFASAQAPHSPLAPGPRMAAEVRDATGAGSSGFLEAIKPRVAVNGANRERYRPHIDRIARQHRLNPALLHAMITAESGYEPRAVSPKGAMGLMQLMPATAERFGVEDPFEPLANINAGARYLRLLLDQFRNINLALAAYNAGERVVQRHGNGIPPYLETRQYVVRVLHYYMYYARN